MGRAAKNSKFFQRMRTLGGFCRQFCDCLVNCCSLLWGAATGQKEGHTNRPPCEEPQAWDRRWPEDCALQCDSHWSCPVMLDALFWGLVHWHFCIRTCFLEELVLFSCFGLSSLLPEVDCSWSWCLPKNLTVSWGNLWHWWMGYQQHYLCPRDYNWRGNLEEVEIGKMLIQGTLG